MFDNLRLCTRCRDRETTNTSGICYACRQQEIIDDSVPEHTDLYLAVDGELTHVLGDPDMSPETREALTGLIRLAKEYVDSEDFDKDNS